MRKAHDPLRPPLSRREVLTGVGLLAAGTVFKARSSVAQPVEVPPPFTDVVDCHIHLWAADKKQFPFHANAPYVPDYVSTLEQWLADRTASGVGIGIFVHGEPYQDDHRYVVHCLEQAPDLLRGTVLCNPNLPETPRRMTDLVRGRPFVAARVHATSTQKSYFPEWRSRNFEKFWETVGELGLVLQMHMHPEWSWELERLVKTYPGVRVVIDHLGRPRQGHSVDYEVTLRLSAYPNVYMKVSSLAGQSGEVSPWPNLKPLVKEIARRFTPARMVWADSFRGGIGAAEYAQAILDTSHLLDFLSPEEQRQIFVDTPRRLFRL